MTICRSCKKQTKFGQCSHCGRWNDSCVLIDAPFKPNPARFKEILEASQEYHKQVRFQENRKQELQDQLEDETRL